MTVTTCRCPWHLWLTPHFTRQRDKEEIDENRCHAEFCHHAVRARKFGLGLVLANQFVSQIKNERIVQAIFGNVGTLISFRAGRADAELLAPQFTPLFDFYDEKRRGGDNAAAVSDCARRRHFL